MVAKLKTSFLRFDCKRNDKDFLKKVKPPNGNLSRVFCHKFERAYPFWCMSLDVHRAGSR